MSNVIKFFPRRPSPATTDLLTSSILWIRTLGDRAFLPVLASMLLVLLAGALSWLPPEAWLWFAGTAWFVLFMTMPLSVVFAVTPGETGIERRSRKQAQARARAGLAMAGLTPLQYISSIPARDVVRRTKAASKFGVDIP